MVGDSSLYSLGIRVPGTKWAFIDGGIRNVPTTTGFSSRVSRNLRGTGPFEDESTTRI